MRKTVDKLTWHEYNKAMPTKLGKFYGGVLMNKEDILKMSQRENKGKLDERELAAFCKASRVGMLVGALLCIVLILVSEFVLNKPELSLVGWMVYFAMQGSSNMVLFRYLKTRTKLVYGIIGIVFAVAFAVALVFKTVV